jgi:hypothetical protein
MGGTAKALAGMFGRNSLRVIVLTAPLPDIRVQTGHYGASNPSSIALICIAK